MVGLSGASVRVMMEGGVLEMHVPAEHICPPVQQLLPQTVRPLSQDPAQAPLEQNWDASQQRSALQTNLGALQVSTHCWVLSQNWPALQHWVPQAFALGQPATHTPP